MRSIYNITKGQLITLWVFDAILFFGGGFLFESETAALIGFLLFFALIFYSIGWKNAYNQYKDEFVEEFAESFKEELHKLPDKEREKVMHEVGNAILQEGRERSNKKLDEIERKIKEEQSGR